MLKQPAHIFARTFQVAAAPVKLTVSIGVAATPCFERGALPERANIAKAEAKRQGRNGVFLARPEGARRMRLRADADSPSQQAWRGAFR